MRIVVMGSGGLGGYFGGLLARSGADVTFVARGAHLQALQERGLTVRSVNGDFTVPVQACADPRALAPAGVVLFCVKTYDAAAAAALLHATERRNNSSAGLAPSNANTAASLGATRSGRAAPKPGRPFPA